MRTINYVKTRQFLEALDGVKAYLSEEDISELSKVLYMIIDKMENENQ